MRTAWTITLYMAVTIAAMTLAFSMTGCSSSDAVAVIITGIILHDGDHRPLAGVTVSDNNVQTTSGADGRFTLAVSIDGATTLYALADGFEVAQRQVSAGQGAIDVGSLYLKPVLVAGRGKITGIVAQAGMPVSAAEVWSGGNRAVTDGDGVYSLYNVPAGQQTVTAAVSGLSGSTSVMVISQRTVTADISVTTGPPIGPF